jgi:nucleoid DNA-binding protein
VTRREIDPVNGSVRQRVDLVVFGAHGSDESACRALFHGPKAPSGQELRLRAACPDFLTSVVPMVVACTMQRSTDTAGSAAVIPMSESFRARVVSFMIRGAEVRLAGVGDLGARAYVEYRPPSADDSAPRRTKTLPFFTASPALRDFVNDIAIDAPAATHDAELDAIAAQIVGALRDADVVEVVGLGTFEVRTQPRGKGVTFVASQALKLSLNQPALPG